MIVLFKKTLKYSLLLLLLFFVFLNLSEPIFKFVSTNIAIRELFLDNYALRNEKGTHLGGIKYYKKLQNHRTIIKTINFNEFLSIYRKVISLDPYESLYKKEYKLLKLFEKLSEINFGNKTSIYIAKNINTYTNLSCDSHMIPFVIPAVSNIAQIYGLPLIDDDTCYRHYKNYGYNLYYLNNKKYNNNYLSKKELCNYAIKNNFNQIIQIYETSSNFGYNIENCA